MTKAQVLGVVNKYYAYHRSNDDSITKFKLVNNVETLGGHNTGYGVYFNFDKKAYEFKGKYLYVCALTIKNPFITESQLYSALITKDRKDDLRSQGYDSVALVRNNTIVEVICFSNSQIEIIEIE